MTETTQQHIELANGPGACTARKDGTEHGELCGAPAYGHQTAAYFDWFDGMDERFERPVYAPGLACPGHGGPARPAQMRGKVA